MKLLELISEMKLGQTARRSAWGSNDRSYILDKETGNFVPDFLTMPYEKFAEIKQAKMRILIVVKFSKEDIVADDWFIENNN